MPTTPPTGPQPAFAVGFWGINYQPDLNPIIKEATPGQLSEAPNSPIIEIGEHATFTHLYQGDYAVCVANKLFPGAYYADNEGNTFRVLSCEIRHKKGNRGELKIVSEWVSGPNLVPPPDEFCIDPQEFNPAIEQLGMFSGIDPQTGLNTGQGLDWEDIAKLRQAADAPQAQVRAQNASNPYDPNDPTSLDSYNAFENLRDALIHGQDTAYVSGLRVVWSRFYSLPQILDRGAYRQAPSSDISLTNGGDIVPAIYVRDYQNKMILPTTADFDWLRQCDRFEFNRVWFKVTRTWLGAPGGTWNANIYPDYNSANPPTWAINPAGY